MFNTVKNVVRCKVFYLTRMLCAIGAALILMSCGGEGSKSGSSGCTVDCPRVYINEAVAINNTSMDFQGDTPDWLELYNPEGEAISMSGWTLTDDIDEPDQWKMPEVTIFGGGYLRVWASGKDLIESRQNLHSNFKISSAGETLYLFDAEGELTHSLLVDNGLAGISVGLSVLDKKVVYYDRPTPESENSLEEYMGITQAEVEFSHNGGVNSPNRLSLSGVNDNQEIRYTLDSSVPTCDSTIYLSPIDIVKNTVVRTRVCELGLIPSHTQSHTYLSDSTHDIAVVTLVTDPLNFFDIETGIYEFGESYERAAPYYGANFWQDWERDVHFTFFNPDGTVATSFDAGVKVFGGWSRSNPQRSLALYARSQYGVKEFEYPFFPNREYEEFQGLILRNSGNDWGNTMMRDVTITSLMHGSGLDTQDYRPSAVYLNGDYWGLYNLREKVNEHFLASRHGVNKSDVDLLEYNGDIIEGSNTEYLALIDFIKNNDMNDVNNYDLVDSKMNIQNYIMYNIVQIYINNTDWPGNNIKFWKSPETKWRWILYDTDFGFGLYSDYSSNTLDHALKDDSSRKDNPPWSTLLLRRLLTGQEFRNSFINRFADELNSRFLPIKVISHIDKISSVISSEIPLHESRWKPQGVSDRFQPPSWSENLDVMKEFAEMRPSVVRSHIVDRFDLSGTIIVNVNIPNLSGSIKVNSLSVDQDGWQGVYFQGVPITLTAMAKDGYVFSHWEGSVSSSDLSVIADSEEDLSITAIFLSLSEHDDIEPEASSLDILSGAE